MANYFQLLIGKHFDATTGKKFTAGDIIGPTERNLVKSFGADKFRKLSDEESQDYIPCCMSNCVRTFPEMPVEEPKRKRIKAKRKVKA